jgi:hypothetical protein
VEPPSFLSEVGKPFLAGVELGESAETLSSLDLGLEGDGSFLAVEGPAPVAIGLKVGWFLAWLEWRAGQSNVRRTSWA